MGLGALAAAALPASVFATQEKSMSAAAKSDEDLIANTVYGKLKGGVAENGAVYFKGVPYGADTSGKNRFLPPKKPASWQGVRDATKYSDNCLQPRAANRSALMASFQDPPNDSEDCLTLNVWTPALDGKKRAVMVWLHGGGFTAGSGNNSNYNGFRLAKNQDVVVVSINHRLGIFGYLYLGDVGGAKYANTGNQGQLDQIATLEWVRDNIANFGGDPNNVTIFGESGGAGKVCALMGMPPAKGLFHRAIAMSGPLINGIPKEKATECTRFIMKELGVTDVEGLHKVEGKALLAAFGKSFAAGFGRSWGPVVNGTDLPRSPFAPDASPVSRDVDFMVGCTKDEGTMLAHLAGGPVPEGVFNMSWEELPAKLEPQAPGADPVPAIAAYRRLYPDYTASDVYFAIVSQLVIRLNTVQLADIKARQGGAPVYSYLLTWPTPIDGGRWGSTHIVDVPLVFDNLANSTSLMGTPEENRIQPLADSMSAAWANFAKTGNPNAPGLPQWPTYDEKQRMTMILDRESKVVADPSRGEREALGTVPAQRMVR